MDEIREYIKENFGFSTFLLVGRWDFAHLIPTGTNMFTFEQVLELTNKFGGHWDSLKTDRGDYYYTYRANRKVYLDSVTV